MNKKILIVDDQYGIRILLTEILQKDGYDLYQAGSGLQALAIIKENLPDLVVLDMKIPGMDGLEILKRLKEYNSAIKVIMMTAYGELDLINKAISLGAITHFSKPFDIDEVRAAIKQELS
jgi:two-component system response regulator (stage 0 sporulation protein F)